MPIQNFTPAWMTEEHTMLFDSAKRFMTEQWGPRDQAWRHAGMMDRQAWEEAGANGFLCASMPEQYGGAGGDFGHEAGVLAAAAPPLQHVLAAQILQTVGQDPILEQKTLLIL